MTQALWTVGGAGVVASLFALGVLWERHRHPPPPQRHEVTSPSTADPSTRRQECSSGPARKLPTRPRRPENPVVYFARHPCSPAARIVTILTGVPAAYPGPSTRDALVRRRPAAGAPGARPDERGQARRSPSADAFESPADPLLPMARRPGRLCLLRHRRATRTAPRPAHRVRPRRPVDAARDRPSRHRRCCAAIGERDRRHVPVQPAAMSRLELRPAGTPCIAACSKSPPLSFRRCGGRLRARGTPFGVVRRTSSGGMVSAAMHTATRPPGGYRAPLGMRRATHRAASWLAVTARLHRSIAR